MSNHKPLPELPRLLDPSGLSVDARNHRAHLLQHFLSDLNEPAIESRQDGWCYVFEEVLDDLSRQIAKGDWLNAIKRGRALKQAAAVIQVKAETAQEPIPPASRQSSSHGAEELKKGEEASHGLPATKPLPDKPMPVVPPYQQLQTLAARPAIPHGEPRIGHLVLCLSSHGSNHTSPNVDAHEHVPANIGCTFSQGVFTLQDPDEDEVGTILVGLDGLDVSLLDTPLRLVGGTFVLKGVGSLLQHQLLFKVLKLAIYVHLSLLLEQHLLVDSGVRVKFPRPKLPPPSPSTPNRAPHTEAQRDKEVRLKSRGSIIPSTLTNFFSRTNLSYRGSQTIASSGRGSLDGIFFPTVTQSQGAMPMPESPPRKSIELPQEGHFAARLRHFSFLGDRRYSFLHGHHRGGSQEQKETPPAHPFNNALKRIEDSKGLLSTSTGVVLALPKVVVDLARKEKERTTEVENGRPKHGLKLKGDERAALTSLLGWDGKDAEGKGMSGILGFVRQQEISVLFSVHVPAAMVSTKTASQQAASSSAISSVTGSETHTTTESQPSTFTHNATTSKLATAPATTTLSSNLPKSGLKPCGKPLWVTYRYFSFKPGDDQPLGDWVMAVGEHRSGLCLNQSGCSVPAGEHEQRFTHDGVRVTVRTLDPPADHEEGENGDDTKHLNDADHSKAETPTSNPTTPILATPAKQEPASRLPSEQATPRKATTEVSIWESCAICNARTTRRPMTTGTWLFSFAKYLELLIYARSICTITPPLCEHTAPPPTPWTSLPTSRFNIIRHFSTPSVDVTFSLSATDDIFELRIPRLQIVRGSDKPNTPPLGDGPTEGSIPEPNDQKKILRREIKKWWESVSDHIDKIETVLHAEEKNEPRRQKALPRLPSVDDAYDVFEDDLLEPIATAKTPTPSSPYPLPPLPPTTPHSPLGGSQHGPAESYFSNASTVATADTDTPATPTTPSKDNSDQLLASLRHNFQCIEQSLYAQIAKTPAASLNDVRRVFLATAKGTRKRLKAWQDKHLAASKSKALGDLVATEPDWWSKGCHAVPGGNFIVRENDWGSIIAHTLSTTDYQLEMVNLSSVRTHSSTTPSPTTTTAPSSSFFSVATGYRLFSSTKGDPDPDQENVVWNEPEQYSAIISRKEHSRDPTSLLSLHNVLRQKNAQDAPSSSAPPSSASRFLNLGNAATSSIPPNGAAPTAAKAKANVGLSTEAAGGQMRASDTAEKVDKLLHDIENDSTPGHSRPPSRAPSIRSEVLSGSGSSFIDVHIRRGKASSIISKESHDSDATIHKDDLKEPPKELPKETLQEAFEVNLVEKAAQEAPQPLQVDPLPPIPPPKELPAVDEQDEKAPPAQSQISATSSSDMPPPTTSGFTNALTTGLNTAIRYVIGNEVPSRPTSPPSAANAKRYHGLLIADTSNIDDRPHIKYDWTVGKRMRFSCTVYYARQFDTLRKKCGIQDIFLRSLSKSANWTAEGGKSKSNFWMSSDQRFIIKTLVNAWNVADLQVLIEHAPSYFRYIEATAGKPTVLAKLMGFYTIEVKNLETGAVQSKSDLLVMENLFYNRHITKTFDLKGIQGRRVKTQGTTTKTLFDGEWIEGQQRTLTLVRPHSKVILREAIRSDAEFLAKSNIMDYSLLLGVDEEKKEIACGLVDTIGSYTFAKTLEYKAKLGLQSGSKEVTVVPPAEYQERFVNTLEGYFVACPDKWSKPLDETKIISDPNSLPSVL